MKTAQERWKVVVDFIRENDVSDICLWAGNATARIEGRIVRLAEKGALSSADVEEMIDELLALHPTNAAKLEKPMAGVDFSAQLFDLRFRVNVVRARGRRVASMRPLPLSIPEPSSVGISQILLNLIIEAKDGLVLITGPTGSGKTTTIAALVEAINRTKQVKIISIEDPIEFQFEGKEAEIIQREVGLDTVSYESGLRETLRQNPDVIVIGEIRDTEAALVALQAAETGHLVIGSLHSSSVTESISRYILLGPKERSAEMRYILGKSLRVITNQRLLRKRGGGRVAVREVCTRAPNVEAVILRGNEQELVSYMLASRELGMIDFQSALKALQNQLEPGEYQRFKR
jgi:twitching motility protein PilT